MSERDYLRAFMAESNAIERIYETTEEEIGELDYFLGVPLTVDSVKRLVGTFTKGRAKIRDRRGMNVRVGRHVAPMGGPQVVEALDEILGEVELGNWTPRFAHVEYETLHPFQDGNGRSGRAVWLWQMRDMGHPWVTGDPAFRLTFLQAYYYQTLDESG